MHIVLALACNSSATASKHFSNSAIAGAVSHLACNVAFAVTKSSVYVPCCQSFRTNHAAVQHEHTMQSMQRFLFGNIEQIKQ